jgi:hypothetical protein
MIREEQATYRIIAGYSVLAEKPPKPAEKKQY